MAEVFEALADDGCLTTDQATLLNEVYAIEGRLEHASPDVDADEVLDAIERFRAALPDLIEGTVEWLRQRGIDLR